MLDRLTEFLLRRPRRVLVIEDNGPGVPPELKDKVFAPYFTTKHNKGGTGLGLAIVHRIVTDLTRFYEIFPQPALARDLFNIVEGLSGIAVSLGVGASTFAIIFFFLGMRAAADREAGRPYLKTVFVVLRIAMVLILLTEIAKVVHLGRRFTAEQRNSVSVGNEWLSNTTMKKRLAANEGSAS